VRGLRDRVGPGLSKRVSRRVLSAARETADEDTSRLAASPGLPWHPACPRTIANAVLQRQTETLLAEAVAAYERERQAARQQEPARPVVPSLLFVGFWDQTGTWPQPRWLVAHNRGPTGDSR
jgi:hypothetical protein